MRSKFNRRDFCKTAALAVGALPHAAPAAARTLKIGHTGITWPMFPTGRAPQGGPPGMGGGPQGGPPGQGAGPQGAAPARRAGPQANPEAIETIIRDIAGLGYHGLELFSWQIEGMEEHGGLGPLLEKYKLPLISAYCGCNLSDPRRRKDEIQQMLRWGGLVKKYGGTIAVIGPNGRGRDFNFNAVKADIVTTLNEVSKALADIGIVGVLHQHTGTTVEFRDEVYAVMEAVDTRYVKFGPDIGQLQKAGVDPVQVVKDFLPLIEHFHIKDFNGGEHYVGYCPLGQGKVNIPAILDLMEGRKMAGMTMVELDSSRNMPLTAVETARVAKEYLQKQGIVFRS
ncbi:MAG: sugar phosphate isomerase/epimerase family protein [Bryobacteraceae bacterium]